MAIPKFYSILAKRYPACHSKLNSRQTCDHLLIDVNCILHNCLERSETEDDILLLLKEFVDHLLFLLNPTKSLYLAVDGIPPLGKIKEQAIRRLKSTRHSNGLDSNIFTPGTVFMQRFNLWLKDYVKSKSSSGKKDTDNCAFLLSTSDLNGEGEQKMMKYMKQYSNENVVLYSSDADLIIMSLDSNHNNVRLVRESFNFRFNETKRKKFEIMDIKILKIKLMASIVGVKQEIVSNDLMLLFMILGNDFLPTPQFFTASDTNIQLILNSLKAFYKENENEDVNPNSFLIDRETKLINFENLFRIFDTLHQSQLSHYKTEHPLSSKTLQEKSLELDLPKNATSLSEKKRLIKDHINSFESSRYQQWRFEFYEKHHNGLLKDLKKISCGYLEKLQWLYDYYTQFSRDDSSDFWTFDYESVPGISDLLECEYSSTNKSPTAAPVDSSTMMKMKDVTPLVHLCLVIPPRSSSLLPLSLQCDPDIKKYNADQSDLDFEKIKAMIQHLKDIDISEDSELASA